MHVHRRHILCSVLAFLLLSVSTRGDDGAAKETQPEPVSEPYVRITQAGLLRYTDNAWGIMQATAFNHTSESVDVNGVAWFSSDPGLQFSRVFRLLPGSTRTVWMPILTPKLPPGQQALDMQWATIRRDGTLASNLQGERFSDSPIRIPGSRMVIANLSGTSRRQSQASELLFNLREEFGPDVLVRTLTTPPFPPAREAWHIANVVTVATDEIATDAAALTGLRLWTHSGGRLWLQLDQIQSSTVSALLGDVLPFVEIDRTSTVDVETTAGETTRNFRPQRIGLERPAAVTRLIVEPPAKVHQWLDDWPAVFSFTYGGGKVLCTTVDMSAWFTPRHWRRHEEIADATDSIWLDASDAGHVAIQELSTFSEPTVAPDVLADYVVSQVGYSTPQRSSVAAVLLGFVLCLGVVSLGLRWRQRSGWMLWVIPVMAVLASGTLVAVGQAARGKPQGRVLGQIVETEAGQTTAHVTEALTYYADSKHTVDESVQTGTPLIPDRTGISASRWRVQWHGLDEWSLQSVELPPGVRLATSRTHLEFSEPLRATATFDRNGLTGQLTVPPELSDRLAVEDALVGGRTRVTHPAIFHDGGTFSVRGRTLPPGEYLDASLLNNEQSRRQKVFRDLFRATGRNRPALQRPHLVFWSRLITPGSGSTAFRDDAGSALFTVPIELRRPAASAEILIPGCFLPYQSVPMTRSGGVPSYFNNRVSEWTRARQGSRILLRFQVPRPILPVSPVSANLTIKLSAGARSVTLSHGPFGRYETAATLDSPVGQFDIPIEFSGPEVLDERGGLHVMLEVSDVQSDASTSGKTDDGLTEVRDEYWKVDWISLAMKARVDGREPAKPQQVD